METDIINKNREEINNLLHSDLPLEIIYARIRMLSAQNERLIKQSKDLTDKSTIK